MVLEEGNEIGKTINKEVVGEYIWITFIFYSQDIFTNTEQVDNQQEKTLLVFSLYTTN